MAQVHSVQPRPMPPLTWFTCSEGRSCVLQSTSAAAETWWERQRLCKASDAAENSLCLGGHERSQVPSNGEAAVTREAECGLQPPASNVAA